MTVVDQDEIAGLDWDVPVNCSGVECQHEGVALVKFRVHDSCQKHKNWYVACQRHLDEARAHRATCRGCRLHLAMTDFRML